MEKYNPGAQCGTLCGSPVPGQQGTAAHGRQAGSEHILE